MIRIPSSHEVTSKMSYLIFKMNLTLLILGSLTFCQGELFTAFYVPEDKLAFYPNHPNFTENKDLYYGFTLKERLFSGEEYDNEVIRIKSYF